MENKELNDELFQERVSLLSMNNLSYELPSALSVVSSRAKFQQFSQPSNFAPANASSQALIIFNQGSAFVNGSKSLLNFTVNVASAAGGSAITKWAFGDKTKKNSGGSCQNLITQVILQSRGGEILFQNLYHNVYVAATTPWKHNKEGYSLMQMMGGVSSAGLFPQYDVGTDVQFSVPLDMISDWFSTASLINPQAMSGAKLLVSFANIADAIVGYKGDGTIIDNGLLAQSSYSLKNIGLTLDMSELYDSANQLIQSSANNLQSSGLQTAFKTYYGALFKPTQSTAAYDINVSAAKVSNVFIKFIKPAAANAPYIPFAGASVADLTGGIGAINSLNDASWQFRLGAQQLPLYPVTTALDTYKQVIDAMCSWKNQGTRDVDALGTLNKPDAVPIGYYDFYGLGSADPAVATAGSEAFCICLDLEKSNAVGVSGVASNNARLISVQLNNWSQFAVGTGFNAYIFVELTSCVNSTSMNNVVDR